MRLAAFLLGLLPFVAADVYMHNPRGSNDRNCERNVNRQNGNRLFDSQNNAKGGYACPRPVGDEERMDDNGFMPMPDRTFQRKRMYYFENSILPIEWTNQHGCGLNSKVNCDIVIQYSCEDLLDNANVDIFPRTERQDSFGQSFMFGAFASAPRDGTPNNADDAATDTIPDDPDAGVPDSEGNRRYGMHENVNYYNLCQHTQRNMGLYTADQRVRRTDMRGTRQNPNGNRRGLECPEERDYYPHPHPSPFVDVAVMTNDAEFARCTAPDTDDAACTQKCIWYLENSFNMHDKCFCEGESGAAKEASTLWNQRQWPNNEADCTANGYTWKCGSLNDFLDGLNYPACVQTQFSRANHLGNADINALADDIAGGHQVTDAIDPSTVLAAVPHGLNANRFIWQVPSIPTIRDGVQWFTDGDMTHAYDSCMLRLRYNISTSDFPQTPDAALEVADRPGGMVDSRNNSREEDDPNLPLAQDPYIPIGPGPADGETDRFVSLAVNTNQFARTFQDRSYVFTIKRLASADQADYDDVTATPPVDATAIQNCIDSGGFIYNVNVRGKRGNIVQTYPAVEYDFVPNMLVANSATGGSSTCDVVHFQWTGSDYNPRRGCNDAEGGPPDPNNFIDNVNNDNARADRNNMMIVSSMAFQQPADYIGYDADDESLSFDAKLASAKAAVFAMSPCYVAGASQAQIDACYEQMMRLAYQDQDTNSGYILLRQGRDCLTEDELDAINNKNAREQHPLNCAKINAAIAPYYDAGPMIMTAGGIFPVFSSRNNNHSNRDHTGILCVNGVDASSSTVDCISDFTEEGFQNVLQDNNPEVNQAPQFAAAVCNDEANANDGTGNNNGAASCLAFAEDDDILRGETFATEQQDSDGRGDGDKESCERLREFGRDASIEEKVGLAIGLLFVGLGTAWLSYYLYNRYKARRNAGSTFGGDKSWQKKGGAATTDVI